MTTGHLTTRPHDEAALHLVCGKIAAGKSTLAARLAQAPRTILISEDAWLAKLFPDEIHSVDDYIRCAARIKAVLAEHVEALLRAGLVVVLDLPFNTSNSRAWGLAIATRAKCAHRLHFIDVADDVCKARLRCRNELGEHPFQTSDAQFDRITSFFTAPAPEERLDVLVYDESGNAR
ncbi:MULTISPECIES: ATP-binding protein [unclassified Achromobacter]|uniref:AAA family ATPase n=1 Tax=unclassified Achromobacter TaxID=2626865 RepID=UPI000B519102|nr:MULTISPECIES: ATP-binding protein [unclassified Achromobacter]OWT80506.1 cell division protein ZipA [Achromobacter sp. HZ34]OWT82389.1 cell division protein ZipA [Achromobacter sp. HZ28]